MTIDQLPYDERPREKLIMQGLDSLSNAELIAILLHTGTREKSAIDLATDILKADKRGILFLGECSPEELQEIKGMGRAKTCQLMAAVELGRRVAAKPRVSKPRISRPADIAEMFMEEMRYQKREHFCALLINTKGEIIQKETIAVGDLSSAIVHPREVFSNAVKRCAAAVVLLHNHPSGDPGSSEEDIETTKRLVEAGEILGIKVLDHIIIGDGIFRSLKKEGFI